MINSDLSELPLIAPVTALVRDLLLGSRISATAKALGREIVTVRDPARLIAPAAVTPDDRARQPGLLLVDLNLDGAIAAAAQWMRQTGGETVGFVSHVDVEAAQRAREAGITRVLARSRFVELLPDLLRPRR